jgi:hypothetical protein
VIEGHRRSDFFNLQFFTFRLTYYQPYESMTGPVGQRLLTSLVNSYLLIQLQRPRLKHYDSMKLCRVLFRNRDTSERARLGSWQETRLNRDSQK